MLQQRTLSQGKRMKALSSIFLLVLVTGCATQAVPIKPKFPEAIPSLMEPCADLKDVPTGTIKLSDTISVVAENYGKYHECKLKNEAWVEWYEKQKQIYDSVK